MDVYIYYRVRDDNAAALQFLVTAMQARLSSQYGVAAQLKRRPESNDGLQTWMEIYPAMASGFEAAIQAAAQDAGLAALTTGPRHTEIFMDMIRCA